MPTPFQTIENGDSVAVLNHHGSIMRWRVEGTDILFPSATLETPTGPKLRESHACCRWGNLDHLGLRQHGPLRSAKGKLENNGDAIVCRFKPELVSLDGEKSVAFVSKIELLEPSILEWSLIATTHGLGNQGPVFIRPALHTYINRYDVEEPVLIWVNGVEYVIRDDDQPRWYRPSALPSKPATIYDGAMTLNILTSHEGTHAPGKIVTWSNDERFYCPEFVLGEEGVKFGEDGCPFLEPDSQITITKTIEVVQIG